jgi:hypothetical protein
MHPGCPLLEFKPEHPFSREKDQDYEGGQHKQGNDIDLLEISCQKGYEPSHLHENFDKNSKSMELILIQ